MLLAKHSLQSLSTPVISITIFTFSRCGLSSFRVAEPTHIGIYAIIIDLRMCALLGSPHSESWWQPGEGESSFIDRFLLDLAGVVREREWRAPSLPDYRQSRPSFGGGDMTCAFSLPL